MATFHDDDSTDDEIGVNLQLAERLRINRGERTSPCEKKSLKNLYNQSRRRPLIDYLSSSSSSLDMHFEPFSSDASGSYGHHNKKRQNGDKGVDHFGNPKRTKVSVPTRLARSPGKRQPPSFESVNREPLISMPSNAASTSRHLLPDNVYEDHMNNLSDDEEDSDFEPRRRLPTTRGVRQATAENSRHFRPQQPEVRRPKPLRRKVHVSGNRRVLFADSMSEEDNSSTSLLPNCALQGGRQSPDIATHKKVLRKAKKILDSDSEEDWQVGYRMRPLILSSSDSEDSTPTAAVSASNFDSNKSDFDHSYYKSDRLSTVIDSYPRPPDPSQFNPHLPSSSSSSASYRTKATSKRSYKNQGRTLPPKPTVQINPINSISISLHSGGVMKYDDAPSTSNGTSSQDRAPRSHRYLVSSKSSKGRHSASSRNQTRPLENVPRVEYDLPGNSSRDKGLLRRERLPSTVPRNEDLYSAVSSDRHSQRPPSPVFPRADHRIMGSHRRSGKLTRGRSARGTSSAKNNLSAIYPDLYDAEDSSEVEFFTAYSDNESIESMPGYVARNPSPGAPVSPPFAQNPQDPINLLSSEEEDEISVVYTGPVARNRGSARTLGRRYNRITNHRSCPRDIGSLSPDPVEQVRQVEEDERFARILQAQFDAEEDPNYVPCARITAPHSGLTGNSSTSEESSDALESIMGHTVGPPTNEFSRHFTILSSPPFQTIFRGLNVRLGNTVNLSFSPRPRNLRRYRNAPLFEALLAGENNGFISSDESFETYLGIAELNGDVPRGLQRSEINRLPTRQFIIPTASQSSAPPEVPPHKRAELNKECQVCLNDYISGDVLRILPCFHEFHTPCIDPWLKINHTCPVCRVIVDVQQH